MNLVIKLTIKFRFALITWGQKEWRFQFPVPAVALLFAEEIKQKLYFNDRGVKLEASLERLP